MGLWKIINHLGQKNFRGQLSIMCGQNDETTWAKRRNNVGKTTKRCGQNDENAIGVGETTKERG
jgi:hypothetical protein